METNRWHDSGIIPPDGGERILGGVIDYYAENREPRLLHPAWQKAAEEKLAQLEQKIGKKPNFFVFIMDDVGWGDMGCYGGGHVRGAPTPHFDRLAAEGLRLTSCYSQPSCSPSRATLMTGRLPIRHGILTPPMYGQPGGLDQEVSLAELLKEVGYVTRAVGKWHCGENKSSVPQNKGFDEFYGFYGVSDMYTEWRDNYFYPEIVNDPFMFQAVMNAKFNKHNILAKTGQFDVPEIEQEEITLETVKDLDEKWAAYSESFIRSMAAGDKPWFLYHGTRGCHFDNYPPDKFKGRSRASYPFTDVLVEMDDIFGRLFRALEETGQLENTLILVTSDNGPEMESWPDSSYTPFRGSKGTTWEGGIRVPGIFYWKGMIEPGQVSDGLFDFCDMLPTVCAMAGVENLPQDRFIDGVDQRSFLLAGPSPAGIYWAKDPSWMSNRAAVYAWLLDEQSALRVGPWKVYDCATEMDYRDTVTPGGFSGHTVHYTYGKVFNLFLDPKEEHSFAIRKLVYMPLLAAIKAHHLKTFDKYPKRIQIKGTSS
ncbi:MAG: sulfatase-like hydrolase/transferase [bacterium]